MFLTQTQLAYITGLYLLIIVFFSAYIIRNDNIKNINKVLLVLLLVLLPVLGILINMLFMLQHEMSRKSMKGSKL